MTKVKAKDLTNAQKNALRHAKDKRRKAVALNNERTRQLRAAARAQADTSPAYRAKNARIAKAENRRQHMLELKNNPGKITYA